MYRLEKINENGNVIQSKDFKTLKECSKAFGELPYHTIQRLLYHCSRTLNYKKAISHRTSNLLKNYRLKKIDDGINIDGIKIMNIKYHAFK